VLRLTVSNHPVERETLAAQAGLLPCLRSEINRLRSEAGFFVDTEIERFILSHTRGSRAAAPANPKAIRTMAP